LFISSDTIISFKEHALQKIADRFTMGHFLAWKGKHMTSGIVYSTEHGRLCPDCGRPVAKCVCRQKEAAPKRDGVVRVSRETKGRKGKGVTLIIGVPLHPEGLRELAKEFKRICGSGGTVKAGVIEIQGDHREALMERLIQKGYRVKSSGG
jgi:translation initiation factor 1